MFIIWYFAFVEPPMVTSPAILIQKPKIGSKEGTAGTISATEIDTLNYEPVEDSEEFYVDMGMCNTV